MYVEHIKIAINKEHLLHYLFWRKTQKILFIEIKNANKGGCCCNLLVSKEEKEGYVAVHASIKKGEQ